MDNVLLEAARNGDRERVRELVAQGHAVNERSTSNITLLHYAMWRMKGEDL
jgi:ankyrin repeat protein